MKLFTSLDIAVSRYCIGRDWSVTLNKHYFQLHVISYLVAFSCVLASVSFLRSSGKNKFYFKQINTALLIQNNRFILVKKSCVDKFLQEKLDISKLGVLR